MFVIVGNCTGKLLLLGTLPVGRQHLRIVLSVDHTFLQPRDKLEADLAEVLLLSVADFVPQRVHEVSEDV